MTRRQWVFAGILAVGFVAAAALVAGGGSGGDADPAPFDEVAWCRAAAGVSDRADVFAPGFDGDGESAIVNLLVELETALSVAAIELRPSLARVNDVVVLVGENLASTPSVPDALAEALLFTDPSRLGDAVDAVSDAMTGCGHDPLPPVLGGAG